MYYFFSVFSKVNTARKMNPIPTQKIVIFNFQYESIAKKVKIQGLF